MVKSLRHYFNNISQEGITNEGKKHLPVDFDMSLDKTTIGQELFSNILPQETAVDHFLSPQELKLLIKQWETDQWHLLSNKAQDDPLNDLYKTATLEWAIIWKPGKNETTNKPLYLIWKEHSEWFSEPQWSLYKDGALIFNSKENKGHAKYWLKPLQKIVDNQRLEPSSFNNFLTYCLSKEPAQLDSLLGLFLAKKPLFQTVKPYLFELLESPVAQNKRSFLSKAAIDQLSQKTILTQHFKCYLENRLIKNPVDIKRLHLSLNKLSNHYHYFDKQSFSPLYPIFKRVHSIYQQLITDGLWRIKLANASDSSM